MKKELSLELVQLKHNVLVNKIGNIDETLRLMGKLIDCQNDINAIHIIFMQYQKMYKAVLASGEYDKYQEVEDIIIPKVSKIEAKLDKYIYKLAKEYPQHISAIENSENYKNFGNLDDELLKIYSLKRLLVNCKVYHSQEEQDRIKNMIYTTKFKVLIRNQIKQMVYENGSGESSLWMNYDDEVELYYFMILLYQTIQNAGLKKDDETVQGKNVEDIIRNNRLLNHVIFRLLEQDIEINPQKYISLLDAKIFNPHMCNIANDPYEEMILYAKKIKKPIGPYAIKDMRTPLHDYKRKNVNLSLLLALLKDVISDENMTIMECSNIYSRFGFECRPIVIYEGQEIVRRIFNKVKGNLEPEEKENNNTKGQYCKIKLIGYNYDFNPKEEPFFTEAQIYQRFANVMWFEDLHEIDRIIQKEWPCLQLKGMRKILDLRNPMLESATKERDNEWVRLPLEQMTKLTETEIPKVIWSKLTIPQNSKMFGGHRSILMTFSDELLLWKEYELDLKNIGVRIKKTRLFVDEGSNVFNIGINLDDIADLPIDFDRIQLLTKEETEGVNKIEGNER